MHQAANDRLELETALRQGLRDEQVSLRWLPVVALRTGRIVAVRAVAEWHRPGVAGQIDLTAVAEEAGLGALAGSWLLDKALEGFGHWRHELGTRAPVTVGVELPAGALYQPDLAERVGTALGRHGVTPAQLELELGAARPDLGSERLDRLAALRRHGVRLAVREFGTGYDSLTTLRRLGVDGVRIGPAWVAALTDPDQDPAPTVAMVRLAQTLDLELVAEGITTTAQLEALLELRCPFGQGDLFAPALPAGELDGLLAAGPISVAGRSGPLG
jgi:EAL domain-containing protein (putative c-di-GMP-specific phosphodiesterase class I)